METNDVNKAAPSVDVTRLVSGLYWVRENGKVTVAEYESFHDEWWMIGDDRNHHHVDEVIEMAICPANSVNKSHAAFVL